MFTVVTDVLKKDFPVGVPDLSIEAVSKMPMEDLLCMWKKARNAFSKIPDTVIKA